MTFDPPLEADSDVVVQSGVKWEDLNATLAEKGIHLFFPVSDVYSNIFLH